MGRIRKRRTRPLGPPAASRFLHNTHVTPPRSRYSCASVSPSSCREVTWPPATLLSTSVPGRSRGVGAFGLLNVSGASPTKWSNRSACLRKSTQRRRRLLRSPLDGDLVGETVDRQLVWIRLQVPCWPLTRWVNAGNLQFVCHNPLFIMTLGLTTRARTGSQLRNLDLHKSHCSTCSWSRDAASSSVPKRAGQRARPCVPACPTAIPCTSTPPTTRAGATPSAASTAGPAECCTPFALATGPRSSMRSRAPDGSNRPVSPTVRHAIEASAGDARIPGRVQSAQAEATS